MDVARNGFTGLSGSVASMVQKNFTDDGPPLWFEKSDKRKAGSDEDMEEEDELEEDEEPDEGE
jgi:hypothetical protein